MVTTITLPRGGTKDTDQDLLFEANVTANETRIDALEVRTASAITLTPDDAESELNVIPAGVTKVRLGANVNDADDFVTLPSLADVPNGWEITIIAGAANCEVRTPADSDEEINSENCDGTKEYLLTATEVHKFVKIDSTIGWMGHGYTAIGAVTTAIVPD